MGYTHYWNFNKSPKEIEDGKLRFETAINLFKDGLKQIPETIKVNDLHWDVLTCTYTEREVEYPFAIAGPMGTGKPIMTGTMLSFNGKNDTDNGGNDNSHETCVITMDDGTSFNFCKTARKPYDVAVCLALLCFKKAFGDYFKYSSDGNIGRGEEGWKLAKEIMSKLK